MIALRSIALSGLALLLAHSSNAADWKISLRANRDRVKYGDPLYIEATILNQGQGVLSAPRPALDLNTFHLTVLDLVTELSLPANIGGMGFFGTGRPVEYIPGKPHKYYWIIFLPDMRWFDHVFWKPIQEGREIFLSATYPLGGELSVRSRSIEILVQPRSPTQMQALREWRPTGAITSWEHGPNGDHYGLRFLEPLVREQVLQALEKFPKGEIADLLRLTLLMKDLYAMAPAERAKADPELVKWLQSQADIKRQALTIHTRNLAAGYNMSSTQHALEKLIADPGFESKK